LHMAECELEGFNDVKCGGRIHRHHLINRGKLRGNTSARIYCEQHGEIFWCDVCEYHNVMRWADTKQARRILLKKKVEIFGTEYCKEVIDGIPWKVKPPELSFQGIMAAPLPD